VNFAKGEGGTWETGNGLVCARDYLYMSKTKMNDLHGTPLHPLFFLKNDERSYKRKIRHTCTGCLPVSFSTNPFLSHVTYEIP
jgi:hypothetical protein